MTSLSEKILEDILIGINRVASENPIALRPAHMFIKREVIQAIATHLNCSFEEALAHIKAITVGEIDAT